MTLLYYTYGILILAGGLALIPTPPKHYVWLCLFWPVTVLAIFIRTVVNTRWSVWE